MKGVLFTLLQLTWGLPQTLAGFIFHLYWRHKGGRVSLFNGAVVTEWSLPSSMSLGLFILLGRNVGRYVLDGRELTAEETRIGVLVHEFGHCVQSLILGPLFLPLAGLPSFLWARLSVFRRLRRRKLLSYYAVYPENWANTLGEWYTKTPSVGNALPRSFLK